jgi:lipopolysaccharide export system permease protein
MEARLVMEEGVALAGGTAGQLTAVRFDQFVFDLSDLLAEEGMRVPRPSEYSPLALLRPTPEMLAGGRYTRGDFVSEGHYKLAMPLLAMTYPMIALVTLLAGGYRRTGFGRRVIVAIAIAALLQVGLFAARARVQANPDFWPLVYLPMVLALAYVGAVVARLSRGRRPAAVPA